MAMIEMKDLEGSHELTAIEIEQARGGVQQSWGPNRPWGRILPWMVPIVMPEQPPVGDPPPTVPLPGPTFPVPEPDLPR